MKYRLEEIADVAIGQSPKTEYYNTEGIETPFFKEMY